MDAEKCLEHFDPHKNREGTQYKSSIQTFFSFLSNNFDSIIFTMPLAFKHAGLLYGTLTLIVTSIACTISTSKLLCSNHFHCRRNKKLQMSFPKVAYNACKSGPNWMHPFANSLMLLTASILGLTYLGLISYDFVLAAKSLEQLMEYYFGIDFEIEYYMVMMSVPCFLLCYPSNIKYLSILTNIAHGMLAIGCFITIYYCFDDMPPLKTRPIPISFTEIRYFFGIAFFSMETIRNAVPLEAKMKSPRDMCKPFGVLNIGMLTVTLFYGFIGFIGYARYGQEVEAPITVLLPIKEIPSQIARILLILGIIISNSSLFFEIRNVMWQNLKKKSMKYPKCAKIATHNVLVTCAVLMAAVIVSVGPFIVFLGGLCFSILSLIVPSIIEIGTIWKAENRKWKLLINIVIGSFGLLCLILGVLTMVDNTFNYFGINKPKKEIFEIISKVY
ncbi:CLUMA_CG000691, isoform A [Clunio marinus]|uniref:CLUMA_CG000691, isoform A n=1 Tax=Clunio marinus TaxID=568069 RepID=A0A1J1HKV2_9DIPT|nr:CLUMA_CG000691, isoform A [Clunio marinus]